MLVDLKLALPFGRLEGFASFLLSCEEANRSARGQGWSPPAGGTTLTALARRFDKIKKLRKEWNRIGISSERHSLAAAGKYLLPYQRCFMARRPFIPVLVLRNLDDAQQKRPLENGLFKMAGTTKKPSHETGPAFFDNHWEGLLSARIKSVSSLRLFVFSEKQLHRFEDRAEQFVVFLHRPPRSPPGENQNSSSPNRKRLRGVTSRPNPRLPCTSKSMSRPNYNFNSLGFAKPSEQNFDA